MQKKLIVAAVAGALAAPLALAQSNVTIYGIADVGVEWGSSGNGTKFRVQSGQESGSRLGFKGSEDLGGGLKANFQLEAGFSLDNGAFTNHGQGTPAPGTNVAATYDSGTLFARQAWAGVSGSFGAVNIGRMYTPIFYVAAGGDPAGLGTVATLANVWGLGSRANNAVEYVSPTMGGFGLRANYSTGEENNVNTDAKKEGQQWGLNGTWGGGPVWVGAAYQEIRGATLPSTTAEKTKNWLVAGTYDFGMVKLFAGWNDSKTSGSAGDSIKFRVWDIGATVKAGPGQVVFAYGDRKDKLGDARDNRLVGVGYDYPLSKRTNLYAFYARVSNKDGFANGVLNSATLTGLTPNLGYDPKALQLGLRHTF
jgi:predicted porin